MALLWGVSISRGQYSVEAGDAPPHPIDKKYEGKLDFPGSNYEMERNIAAAEKDWRALMKEKLNLLLNRLPAERRKQMNESQDAWAAALEKDRLFFFGDHEQLRYSVGREGEILSEMEFMYRVRKRALDLTEYVKIFVTQRDEKPNPQGGATNKQPFTSETNRTSAAAASRRSP